MLITQNLQGETSLYHYDNPKSHQGVNILTADLSAIPSPNHKSRGAPTRMSSIAPCYDSKQNQILFDPESNARIIGNYSISLICEPSKEWQCVKIH